MADPYPVKNYEASMKIGDTACPFISSTLGARIREHYREGMRGIRSEHASDVARDGYDVGGTIVLEPSPALLAALVGYAYAADGSPLTDFSIIQAWGATKTRTFANCKINRLVIAGSSRSPITTTIDVIGKTYTSTGTVGTPDDALPYMFSHATLTLQSAARITKSFSLEINNNLEADNGGNSATLLRIPEGMRVVTLETVHDYHSENAALIEQAVAGATGTLVLNDGTTTKTATFGTLQVPHEDPPVSGGQSQDIPLTLRMRARKTTSVAQFAWA